MTRAKIMAEAKELVQNAIAAGKMSLPTPAQLRAEKLAQREARRSQQRECMKRLRAGKPTRLPRYSTVTPRVDGFYWLRWKKGNETIVHVSHGVVRSFVPDQRVPLSQVHGKYFAGPIPNPRRK